MKVITLRFSTTKLTPSELVYSSSIDATLQQSFETIKYMPANSNVVVEQGTLNNGRQFQHVLYSNKEHEITLSTNEISATVLTFLKAFWKSQYKYLSAFQYANNAWSDYVQVNTEGGLLPITYIDDIIHFPELTMKLIEVYPEA